jgi:thiol-disulfide isomerase/thioredoxin
MDSERRRGAVFVIPAEGLAANARIQLQPLHRVSYRFQNPGSTDLRQTHISLRPASGSPFSQIGGAVESSILLPPGAYTFEILVPGGAMNVDFAISTRDLTMDPILLPATIASHYGRPAPSLSDVEPVNKTSFSAGGLRGKSVLVYFWGYWCAPCIDEGLPKLTRFYEQNRQHLDAFEIVAIHENGVAGQITAEELRETMISLEKDKWSGKPLPFPVLLDRTGETIKSWGIVGYPTTAIIDPKGELMRGDLDTLLEAIKSK